MPKKSGTRTYVHSWILRLAVILSIPLIYASDVFGLANDTYRLSIFLILAAVVAVSLLMLKRLGRIVYVALFCYVIFTYIFDRIRYNSLDLLTIGPDIISPYFLIPLLFGVYLFTSPVQRLLR